MTCDGTGIETITAVNVVMHVTAPCKVTELHLQSSVAEGPYLSSIQQPSEVYRESIQASLDLTGD